ncbi:hypothetical protein F5J12DRAFT_789533 [Pisolithus orientalis]|uniref:uncharacterized protein n=1 Tax=Pisolithus orientalis TaxID=936130 RepID=UPI002224F1EC|nr:uncharacterized protein F5J12DRAFT_789533 [Pisolithus orientalis]KAI6034857.1 hypothetical protein F5J12DRAFT_789533 [Pisolithus orientalis]
MMQPLWSSANAEFIEQLAVELAGRFLNNSSCIWLENKHNKDKFHAAAKHTLNKVMTTFKTVARIMIKDAYSLRIPINMQRPIGTVWCPAIDQLLDKWTFTDATITLPTGQTLCATFHHPAVSTIIHETIHSPQGKLSNAIPPDTRNIDCLIAFTITII